MEHDFIQEKSYFDPEAKTVTCINCRCSLNCKVHKNCEEGILSINSWRVTEIKRNVSLGKRKELLEFLKIQLLTNQLTR